MRTTVSLDPDTSAIVRRLMRERGMTFKQALNEAIRAGTTRRSGSTPFRTRTVDMGRPAIPVDKALRLAAQLEDDEMIRKLALRK
ncbi:MAG TPA: antitoxin [Candidatus Limnocylindria bacterium]|nr:antitoxin [Candidatus Limnocylindria bacterium]